MKKAPGNFQAVWKRKRLQQFAGMLAIALATPSLLAVDPDAKTGLCVAGLLLYAMYIVLCSLLFTSEPPGPSRRVLVRWDRARAGALRRFLGPGLARTMSLVIFMCALGIGVIGGLDGVASATVAARHTDEIAVVAAYVAPFCVFAVGLVALLRARSSSAWVARIVASGILFLIGVLPWVAAAVTGLMSDSSPKAWTAIAAPSPFFLVPMLDELSSYAHTAPMIVPTGLTFAYGWGFLGLVMLGVAKRKSDRILAERDAILRRADLALGAEAEAHAPAQAADAAP